MLRTYNATAIFWVITLLISNLVRAQSELSDTVIEVLPLDFSSKGLHGEGGDRLRKQLANAQFIALGEDHGFAGAALFGQAIAQEASTYGLKHHAIEVGPVTVDWFESQYRKGGLRAMAKAHPNLGLAVPFISNIEDAELAADFIREEGSTNLWGIDQEFIGAPLILLQELVRIAKSDAAKRTTANWLESEQAAFSAGDLEAGMLISASIEDFAALRSLYPDNIVAHRIIDALAHSAETYRYVSDKKYYANNLARVITMRNLFLQNYHAASEPTPRVLLKLGLYHLGRGTTPTSMFDLGSILSGLAAAEHLNSLHIAYVPIAGQQSAYSPSAKNGTKVLDYSNDNVTAIMDAAGISSETLAKKGHFLIPLEPIRHTVSGKKLRSLPTTAKFIVQGFDYLITSRNEMPAKQIRY